MEVGETADRESYGFSEHCLNGNFGSQWINKRFYGSMGEGEGRYEGKAFIQLVPQTAHKYRDKFPGAVSGEQTVKFSGRESLPAHFPVRWMVRFK